MTNNNFQIPTGDLIRVRRIYRYIQHFDAFPPFEDEQPKTINTAIEKEWALKRQTHTLQSH